MYFAAVGGAAALMASCVTALEVICWEDLGCEALRELGVEDMPLTVVIDAVSTSPPLALKVMV